jgi:hypothetical protein
MKPPPCFHQGNLVFCHPPENLAGLMLAAPYDLANFGLEQIDHHDPSCTENMDMSWVMVAGVNHHAPAIDA